MDFSPSFMEFETPTKMALEMASNTNAFRGPRRALGMPSGMERRAMQWSPTMVGSQAKIGKEVGDDLGHGCGSWVGTEVVDDLWHRCESWVGTELEDP